jgi:flagellar hook-associated protein FlgK
MADVLNESNALASELANVNAKIRGAGVPGVGYPTADLLDERDRLLSRLSELLGGHAIIDGDGTGSFEISGTFLVNREIASQFTNASGSVPITADQDFSGIKIKMAGKLVSTQIETLITVNQNGNNIEVPDERFAARSIFTSGKAGAFAHLLNDFVPTMNRVLSVASAMLVHHVNSYSSNAAASHDPQKAIFGFLDANGETTFPNLGKVNTDPADLSTLLEDGNGNWLSFDQILENIASGDPSTWEALRELGDQIDASRLVSIGKYTDDKFSLLTSALSVPIGRTSDGSVSGTRSNFLEAERAFFSAPVTYITSSAATTFAAWRSNDTANQTLLSSLTAQKESISGVNLDEEAANLVKYQQLYNASSKVIQTSKQMFDTLLAMMSGN